MKKAALAVAGSLNMDFVAQVSGLPAPGQTVLGSGFQMLPGGKGANQACAAGRLAAGGLDVRMIGCVGYDLFADHLKASLSASGVDVSGVRATQTEATGIAMIWVDQAGQNSIVVASGANALLEARDVPGWKSTLSDAQWVLFQLETPLETVAAGLRLSRELGAATMLDPAPAQPLPGELIAQISLLTPNETEASILLGRPPGRIEVAGAGEVTRALRGLGVGAVVLKLGDQGCFWDDGKVQLHVPAFAVRAVDATAAGDTFNGALAVALTEGQEPERALRFANAAAALSVTRPGAQASIPSRNEVDEFLKLRS